VIASYSSVQVKAQKKGPPCLGLPLSVVELYA
jgi:hypothetical protein